MNTTKRNTAVAATGTTLVLAGACVLATPQAFAAAPNTLAVYFAGSSAAPVGITSRVPAETVGGLLVSASSVQLGKAQATAAGGTLGPLGDAFVVSSAPPGTVTGFPSVVTAQDPPSESSPRRAELSGGRGGGAGLGQVRSMDLSARASDFPEAGADASGNALLSGILSTGASVSRSASTVLPDGTVITQGYTAVQDVVIGSAPTQLTIASVDSTASITAKPGSKPVPLLQVHFSGAQLAGVPVVIDDNGVRIADQAAVPASSIQMLNTALQGLAAQGITVSAVPSTRSMTRDDAKIAGAALSIRYTLPASAIPRPSDIGTDETFDLASVTAAVTARARQARDGQTPGATVGAGPARIETAGTTPAAGSGAGSSGPLVVALPTGATSGRDPIAGPADTRAAAADAAPTPVAFGVPRRGELEPTTFRDGYRSVLLVAALGFSGLVAVFRKRSLH